MHAGMRRWEERTAHRRETENSRTQVATGHSTGSPCTLGGGCPDALHRDLERGWEIQGLRMGKSLWGRECRGKAIPVNKGPPTEWPNLRVSRLLSLGTVWVLAQAPSRNLPASLPQRGHKSFSCPVGPIRTRSVPPAASRTAAEARARVWAR